MLVESDLLEPRRAAPATAHGGRARLTDDEWARLAQMTGLPEAELVDVSSSRLLGGALAALTRVIEPMDRGIQVRATAAGKAVVFLEGRDLTAITDGDGDAIISEGQVRTQLRQVIAQPRTLRAALRQLVRAYASGGPDGCAATGAGEFVDQLNDDWQAGIEAVVARGDAFVAIGCRHLDGPGGVIARLRARGHTITRVAR